MKVLVYGNRKQDDMIWDISSPEKHSKAFLKLFNYLRDEWHVYEGDYWGGQSESKMQKQLYELANSGDAAAAEKLLTRRRTYEYEEWHFGDVR